MKEGDLHWNRPADGTIWVDDKAWPYLDRGLVPQNAWFRRIHLLNPAGQLVADHTVPADLFSPERRRSVCRTGGHLYRMTAPDYLDGLYQRDPDTGTAMRGGHFHQDYPPIPAPQRIAYFQGLSGGAADVALVHGWEFDPGHNRWKALVTDTQLHRFITWPVMRAEESDE